MNVLQQMQDSEINFKLECFWDAGFLWMLGDEMNGYIADGAAQTFDETVEALKQAALKHYPESVFAKRQAGEEPDGYCEYCSKANPKYKQSRMEAPLVSRFLRPVLTEVAYLFCNESCAERWEIG